MKVLFTAGIVFTVFSSPLPKKTPVVIAYVGGYRGLVKTEMIEAEKITHINYAFVNIRNGRAYLQNEGTDTVNFLNLIQLKKKNKNLKVLISLGGWSWSEHFSDAALSDSTRRLFAASAAGIVQRWNLDGIDIDWEYPGLKGEDNVFRAEDRENFTLLLRSIRESLDALRGRKNKYQLTIASGGFPSFLEHTDMKSAQRYLDYVNIMSYDFKTGADKITGHHTNLYALGEDLSADKAVRDHIRAGIPPSKLVIGIAFYARSWNTTDTLTTGMGRPGSPANGAGYSMIRDTFFNDPQFSLYFDTVAKASWLFNSTTKRFLSFDDERSVSEKCKYVKENNLGGVMFWEYFSDPKGYLLNTIHNSFRK